MLRMSWYGWQVYTVYCETKKAAILHQRNFSFLFLFKAVVLVHSDNFADKQMPEATRKSCFPWFVSLALACFPPQSRMLCRIAAGSTELSLPHCKLVRFVKVAPALDRTSCFFAEHSFGFSNQAITLIYCHFFWQFRYVCDIVSFVAGFVDTLD